MRAPFPSPPQSCPHVYLQLRRAPATAPLHHSGLIRVISWPDGIAADTVFAACERAGIMCVLTRVSVCLCAFATARLRSVPRC